MPPNVGQNSRLPKLAVITATRGDSVYWDDMLSSIEVLEESIDLIHIIVGPQREIFKLKKLRNTILVPEAGKGLYPALNQGIEVANSISGICAVTYINDDDGLLPGVCAAMEHLLVTNADVVYGNIEYVDMRNAWCGPMSVCRCPGGLLPLLSRGISGMSQQGTLIAARVFQEGARFDCTLSLVSDSSLFSSLLMRKKHFVFAPLKLAFYRQRTGQLSSDEKAMERERKKMVLWIKKSSNVSRWQALLWTVWFRLENVGNIVKRVRRSGFRTSRAFFSQ